MDLKTLEQTSRAGLEQWRPGDEGHLPVAIADVSTVCAALGVPPPAGRDAFTLASSWRSSACRGAGAGGGRCTSRRLRYTINGLHVGDDRGGCRRFARCARWRSSRSEAGRVVEAVREMGLRRLSNISYPRGLKAVVGMTG